jgi:hypothetical protein
MLICCPSGNKIDELYYFRSFLLLGNVAHNYIITPMGNRDSHIKISIFELPPGT